jgi:hypothetical protein
MLNAHQNPREQSDNTGSMRVKKNKEREGAGSAPDRNGSGFGSRRATWGRGSEGATEQIGAKLSAGNTRHRFHGNHPLGRHLVPLAYCAARNPKVPGKRRNSPGLRRRDAAFAGRSFPAREGGGSVGSFFKSCVHFSGR